METQQLVDLGKQMNLEGEERHGFVRAEQALARYERALIGEEKRGEEARIAAEAERIAAKEEVVRIDANEEAVTIAAKEEAVGIAAKEEAVRIAAKEEAVRIAAMEEAERIRQHDTEV